MPYRKTRSCRKRCQRVGGPSKTPKGFVPLPILPRHLDAVRSLTCAHPDPFDRLLIAQAQGERLTLLTRDAAILGLGLDGIVKG